MKLLVDGASLARPTSRMAAALAGLAQRGHELHWFGAEAPGGRMATRVGPRGLFTLRADLVVGAASGPLRTAALGWLAGAHVMVLELSAEGIRRWGAVDRWAWHSLYSTGLLDEADAQALAATPHGIEHDRIGLWPGAPPAGPPDAAHPDTEVLERACERALARHRGLAPRAAIFLDRDGTLIRETGYLSDPDTVELLPGVGRALRNLAAAGYPLVVVSNQSGVARGMFTATRVHEVMARLRHRLREHGVELASVRFCPHHPDQGCACRKPRPGLLELAAEDLVISLRDSVAIGDKRLDVAAAHNAGARGVLVRTGYGRDQERLPPGNDAPAERVCEDLAAAAEWILGEERG